MKSVCIYSPPQVIPAQSKGSLGTAIPGLRFRRSGSCRPAGGASSGRWRAPGRTCRSASWRSCRACSRDRHQWWRSTAADFTKLHFGRKLLDHFFILKFCDKVQHKNNRIRYTYLSMYYLTEGTNLEFQGILKPYLQISSCLQT
jgi:hypothetical protein